MLFNSLEFIFIFLPFVLIGYLFVRSFAAKPIYSLAFLALASLIFYGYWDWHFLPIIICSIFLNYFFGLLVGDNTLTFSHRRCIFIVAVVANLSAIFFYKYINFSIDIVNGLVHHKIPAMDVILPLGISFFTFTQIAYLADVFFGHPREVNFIKYALFVTYFPHLVAGPILHHKEMMPQFNEANANNKIATDKICMGITIFALGLFKKVIFADGFAQIANPVFSAASHHLVASIDGLIGALAYTMQIYFDFSAYSDMAIGLSLMFGIILPFNFDSPYKSHSIIEFWQRWHITLSRFLRDYLYIALGGNRRGPIRRYLNLMLTMLLGGLWHGAGWTFVVWGFLHGIYLVINHFWRGLVSSSQSLGRFTQSLVFRLFSLLLTQFCVLIAWIYFRADSIVSANRMMTSIFSIHHGDGVIKTNIRLVYIILILIMYLVCFTLPNINAIYNNWQIGFKTYLTKKPFSIIAINWNMNYLWAMITSCVLLTSLLFILIVGDGTQFIYFQF